jgi:hypothetical protein
LAKAKGGTDHTFKSSLVSKAKGGTNLIQAVWQRRKAASKGVELESG